MKGRVIEKRGILRSPIFFSRMNGDGIP